MIEFIVERVDTDSGSRDRLPERFVRQEEAAAMAAQLTLSNPRFAYIVKLVPAA